MNLPGKEIQPQVVLLGASLTTIRKLTMNKIKVIWFVINSSSTFILVDSYSEINKRRLLIAAGYKIKETHTACIFPLMIITESLKLLQKVSINDSGGNNESLSNVLEIT